MYSLWESTIHCWLFSLSLFACDGSYYIFCLDWNHIINGDHIVDWFCDWMYFLIALVHYYRSCTDQYLMLLERSSLGCPVICFDAGLSLASCCRYFIFHYHRVRVERKVHSFTPFFFFFFFLSSVIFSSFSIETIKHISWSLLLLFFLIKIFFHFPYLKLRSSFTPWTLSYRFLWCTWQMW